MAPWGPPNLHPTLPPLWPSVLGFNLSLSRLVFAPETPAIPSRTPDAVPWMRRLLSSVERGPPVLVLSRPGS